jgi:hypothetical protein
VGGDVQNITLDAAVELDTTVNSLSGLGNEPSLILASRGDTLDTRVIIRFDTLPSEFVDATGATQTITSVDSAYILLRVDTLSVKGAGPFTIEAYDVDTTANDTTTAAVLALFRPDRFISSQVLPRTDLKDSTRYYISNAAVLARIQNGAARFRVGLRVTSTTSSQIRLGAAEGGGTPLLIFRPTPDTATTPIQVTPLSKTPTDDPIVASHLTDYTIVAKGPAPAPPSVLAVGGWPPRRVYLRFDIPAKIMDSSTVVRATLLLNQISTVLDPTDSVFIIPELVLAGKVVTDPSKAAQIVADIFSDTLKVRPGNSGPTTVEIARAFELWRASKPDTLPRAIILKSLSEGNLPLEIRFSSMEDAIALRPRLRISYTSRVPLGVP